MGLEEKQKKVRGKNKKGRGKGGGEKWDDGTREEERRDVKEGR